MKRVSIVALGLFIPFVSLAACSSSTEPDDGNGTPQAGAGTTAGSPSTAGTPSTAGSPSTAGAATGGAGSGAGGAATAGGGAGGAAAGSGGAATGGAGAATGGAGAGGGGGSGGANPACPAKIDSQVMCTQIIQCPNAYCGVFKLGSKNCDCAAATGPFKCTSCDYSGSTEPIVQKPTEALPACAAADSVLEDMAGCTLNDRCKSLTADKDRFCACFTDPVKGAAAWDCDAVPAAWK
jgi:hypothetical protein